MSEPKTADITTDKTTESSQKPHQRKPFDLLTIKDDYMFKSVMVSEERIKPLLEMVLGKKIRKIVLIEKEKTMENGYNSRGIRMDVYIEDDEDTVYDVEMQGINKRFFGRRFRYYQSSIDVDIVKRGESFGKLKKSIIIFICDYDPFGKGWYVYPFERTCLWDSKIKIKDDTHWYVLNIKGNKDAEGHKVNDEIKELLSFMNGNEPKSDYTRMLDAAVADIKRSDERRHEYMSISAQMSDEREVGQYRTYVTTVRKNKRNLADDVLADTLDVNTNVLKTIRFVINAHPDWDDTDVAVKVLDMEAEEELKAMVESDDGDEDVTK
mgnify:CR=1 FL=1